MRTPIFLLGLILSFCAPALHAAGAPDGTAFEHPVLGVDGPGLLRIKYCGLPLQVRLANLQFKGPESEKAATQYLKETLSAGKIVKVAIEQEAGNEGAVPVQVQLFLGSTHVNVDMVQRGKALSDGRSEKYAQQLQKAMMEASTKKLGVWSGEALAAVTQPAKPVVEPVRPPVDVAAKTTAPVASEKPIDKAPEDYSGVVVADLNAKEYHLPGSRYALSIRTGSRIEYKSPEEAERAGKVPSPFSFPDRAQARHVQQASAPGSKSPDAVVEASRKALVEAQGYMQEAYKLSKISSASKANENYRKAAKLLGEHLDLLTPIADARPNDQALQKLMEEMSTSLYSCNKYQTL